MKRSYYDINYKNYISETFNCDMTKQYNFFEKYLDNPKTIMDLGFGSARDTIYFKSKGYTVYALDQTKAFCDNAKKLGIDNVYNLSIEELNFNNMFDGIWACASLLHISSKDLNLVFKKCCNALKENGIMYVSFKYGKFEGIRDDRFYLDLNEESLNFYLKNSGLMIKDILITEDARNNNKAKWLNAILTK